MDYSSAFNTTVPATLVAKLQTLGLNRSLCSWNPGLPDRQKSGGQNGQTIPHPPLILTLVLRWAASSAHSCTPAASDPALAD